MRLHALSALCTIVLFSNSPARGDTIVVDDSGGADFTDLPAATAAAAAGDLILVFPGSYSPFTLSVGATVLGTNGVSVSGRSLVNFVDVGDRAVISNLFLERIKVERCDGTVVLDSLTVRYGDGPLLFVNQSADVRIQRCTAEYGDVIRAARFVSSRVEVTSSEINGTSGYAPDYCSSGTDGSDGLLVASCPRVHFARSSVRAGDGGDPDGTCGAFCSGEGGVGGQGLIALTSGIIACGRDSDEVLGGRAGIATDYNCDGYAGNAVQLSNSTFRRSGMTIQGGFYLFINTGTHAAAFVGGAPVLAAPPDPTLTMIGTPSSQGTVLLDVDGAPGSVCVLVTSERPELAATPGVLIEALVERDQAQLIGVIPPSGTLQASYTLPSGNPGDVSHAQVEVFVNRATRMRTNSLTFVLR